MIENTQFIPVNNPKFPFADLLGTLKAE